MAFGHAWQPNQDAKYWHVGGPKVGTVSPPEICSVAPNMLRLKKRADFLFVRKGQYKAQGGVLVQMRENKTHNHIRIGFTATRKIGNAVLRNRARRRLKALVPKLLRTYGRAGCDYVFVARKSITHRSYTQLYLDLEHAVKSL